MTLQERINAEKRVEELEKEIADLKQQLEGRQTHVRVPLSVFNFENPKIRDIDKLDDTKLHELVKWLEDEVGNRISIIVPWW